MTRREVLINLENLYETVLQVEQMRRNQPPEDEPELVEEWLAIFIMIMCLYVLKCHAGVPLSTLLLTKCGMTCMSWTR